MARDTVNLQAVASRTLSECAACGGSWSPHRAIGRPWPPFFFLTINDLAPPEAPAELPVAEPVKSADENGCPATVCLDGDFQGPSTGLHAIIKKGNVTLAVEDCGPMRNHHFDERQMPCLNPMLRANFVDVGAINVNKRDQGMNSIGERRIDAANTSPAWLASG